MAGIDDLAKYWTARDVMLGNFVDEDRIENLDLGYRGADNPAGGSRRIQSDANVR